MSQIDRPIADEALTPVIHDHRTVWQRHRQMDAVDVEVLLTPERPPVRKIYEVMRAGRVAIILPFDPIAGKIVLLRQFRVGAHLAHGRGLSVEVVAGRAEPGEDLEATARREKHEECGLDALSLEVLFDVTPNPAITDEFSRIFLARVDVSGLPSVAGAIEEEETILPFTVTPEELFAAVDAGRVHNGYVILCALWFRLNRAAVEARWGLKR